MQELVDPDEDLVTFVRYVIPEMMYNAILPHGRNYNAHVSPIQKRGPKRKHTGEAESGMMSPQPAAAAAAAAAQAIAELSTTGALAARTIRLLRGGLFLRGPAVPMRDRDAWVQRRCSAGRVLCAQLPPDSQVWRRWQLPN